MRNSLSQKNRMVFLRIPIVVLFLINTQYLTGQVSLETDMWHQFETIEELQGKWEAVIPVDPEFPNIPESPLRVIKIVYLISYDESLQLLKFDYTIDFNSIFDYMVTVLKANGMKITKDTLWAMYIKNMETMDEVIIKEYCFNFVSKQNSNEFEDNKLSVNQNGNRLKYGGHSNISWIPDGDIIFNKVECKNVSAQGTPPPH